MTKDGNNIQAETKEKIQQLQLIEQSLHASLVQKQSFQLQQAELESALNELKDKKTAYRIIGNILVESDADGIRKELDGKRELLAIRLKSIDKQEEKIRDKMKGIQQEVLKGMDK